nr:hypothetical protein CFP56_66383 [Quercus suber]
MIWFRARYGAKDVKEANKSERWVYASRASFLLVGLGCIMKCWSFCPICDFSRGYYFLVLSKTLFWLGM